MVRLIRRDIDGIFSVLIIGNVLYVAVKYPLAVLVQVADSRRVIH